MAGLTLCLTAALGCVTYIFTGGESPLLAFAICASALLVGQVVLGAYAALQADFSESSDRKILKKVATFGASQDVVKKQSDFVLGELSALKAEGQARGQSMIRTLDELKTSYEALARSMKDQAAVEQTEEIAFAPAPQTFAPSRETKNLTDQLSIALEPIVDLATGRTAHYRIHLGPVQLIDQVDHFGKRPELDSLVLNEALNLLQRLRQRDPQIRLFMTLGDDTLASPSHMLQLLETLLHHEELSEALVFEITHARLAALSASALEGLGSLVRSNQILALADVSMSGLDPASLQGLNVRHVSINANMLDLRFGVPASDVHFVQLARISNVQVMLSNVTDVSSLADLRQLSRLGSGPAFAAPRRIRRDATPAHVDLAA
jgi:EAL domain-containing protein (putative c-di-GMP-specific phosphodiesterase class I)